MLMEMLMQGANLFIELGCKNIIPIIIFIVFFLIDFILGLCKGIFIEGISSSKLRLSVPKFCAYLCMILTCILLDMLSVLTFDIEYSPITIISIIAFCLFEIKSITENAKTLGIKIPNIVITTISNLISHFNKDNKE